MIHADGPIEQCARPRSAIEEGEGLSASTTAHALPLRNEKVRLFRRAGRPCPSKSSRNTLESMAMIDELQRRLDEGEVIVIDGGMGTELQARGAPMDHEAWCGLANLDHYDTVREIHEDYIHAGADVHITNTYPTVRYLLELAGYGDKIEEINRRAVQAALEARERVADRPVFIAGSMCPVWGIEEAREKGLLGPGDDALLEAFREQASILADAGVDLLLLEMFGSSWLPGLQAAAETGLPVWIGPMAGLGGNGRATMRELPDMRETDFAEALPRLLGPGVSAITVMHSELEAIVPALEVVATHWSGPFGAYPHVGTYERPNWTFTDVAPEDFASEALRWVQTGAQLVGGCCGTGPSHIRAIKERVPTHAPRVAH
jgi:S-methylmethionine-dependent homocysteine/selenocysteine methylase